MIDGHINPASPKGTLTHWRAQWGKCLSSTGLADGEEKYPGYDVRSNPTGWVSQYREEKNNGNYNPQSLNACVCSICITDWPDDSVVCYSDLLIGRKVLPGTVAIQLQHTMCEAPMLYPPPTLRLLCHEAVAYIASSSRLALLEKCLSSAQQ